MVQMHDLAFWHVESFSRYRDIMEMNVYQILCKPQSLGQYYRYR